MYQRVIFILWLLLISTTVNANEIQKGEKLYQNNCAACHKVNRFSVGPSLVEISKKYPKKQQKLFLQWTNNPGKINPNTIQMPAMAHLGDAALKQIHQYVLRASKNEKEKKGRHSFTPFKAPEPSYPFVKRTYMPLASPASIAVVFNSSFGLSWDAAIKRIRYAFPNTHLFFSGEKSIKKAENQVMYSETGSQFWSFGSDESIAYKGYRLQSGLPEFLYEIDNISISESITPGINNKSFVRTYRVTGLTRDAVMAIKNGATIDLSHAGKATVVSSVGNIHNNKLILSAADLAKFSITVTIHD